MLMLLSFLYLLLLTPSISPSPVTSSPLPRQILLYSVPSKIYLTVLLSFHVPPLTTGPLTMDICITRVVHIYVPPPACSSLLHSIHLSPLLDHLGHFRTKAIIERNFWWPGLTIFVNNFVTGCTVCHSPRPTRVHLV